MCLRKENTTYTGKDCKRQCDRCKMQEMMQLLLQMPVAKAGERIPAEVMTTPIVINQNQYIPLSYQIRL